MIVICLPKTSCWKRFNNTADHYLKNGQSCIQVGLHAAGKPDEMERDILHMPAFSDKAQRPGV